MPLEKRSTIPQLPALASITRDTQIPAANGLDPAGRVKLGTIEELLVLQSMQDRSGAIATGGEGNDYTFESARNPAALTNGFAVRFRADRANTGAATLKISALDAKALKKAGGAELESGDLIQDGMYYATFIEDDDEFLIGELIASDADLPAASGVENDSSADGDTVADALDALDSGLADVEADVGDLQDQIDALAGGTSAGLPPGHLSGLTYANNATDATNDIDIATGRARDSANAADMVLGSALTKRLDATFTAGNNNGGRFATSIADGVWGIFLISNGTTVDVGFSQNADPTSDPSYPGGYTSFRRIGYILRASGAIVGFKQNPSNADLIWLNEILAEFNVTNNTATKVTVTSNAPPNVNAFLSAHMISATSPSPAGSFGKIRPISETDAAAADSDADINGPIFSFTTYSGGPYGSNTTNYGATPQNRRIEVMTDSSRQYWYRKSANGSANVTFKAGLLGWSDKRGA